VKVKAYALIDITSLSKGVRHITSLERVARARFIDDVRILTALDW